MVSSVLSYLSKDNNRNGLYNIVSANYEGYPVQFGLHILPANHRGECIVS